MARHKHNKVCRLCKEPFKGWWNQKTCPVCLRERRIKLKPAAEACKPRLATATVGTIAELKVAVDLMSRGFDVFRAMSPASPCDLMAMKEGRQFDIEVRTAVRNPVTGKIYRHLKGVKAMWIAHVIGDEIIYEPELE